MAYDGIVRFITGWYCGGRLMTGSLHVVSGGDDQMAIHISCRLDTIMI